MLYGRAATIAHNLRGICNSLASWVTCRMAVVTCCRKWYQGGCLAYATIDCIAAAYLHQRLKALAYWLAQPLGSVQIGE